jgi:hypothetical protein
MPSSIAPFMFRYLFKTNKEEFLQCHEKKTKSFVYRTFNIIRSAKSYLLLLKGEFAGSWSNYSFS